MDSDDDMNENGFDAGNNTITEANETPSSGKATLKRGDACLACRRRRIRCDAAKPACATCVRLKKQCIYETGKSTSRIAQLKARIAELEAQLQKQSKSPEQSSPNGLPTSHSSTGLAAVAAAEGGPAVQSSVGLQTGPSTSPHVNTHQLAHSQPQQTQDPGSYFQGPPGSSNGQTISPSALGFSRMGTLPVSDTAHTSSGHPGPTTPGPPPHQQLQQQYQQLHPLQHQQQQPSSHPHEHQHTQQRPATAPELHSPLAAGHARTDTLGAVLGAAPPRSNRPHYPQSTGPRPLGVPDPNFDFDFSFLDQPMADLNASMGNASVAQTEDGSMIAAAMRRYHGISARSDVTGVPMRSPRNVSVSSPTYAEGSPLGQAAPGEVPAYLNKVMGPFLKQHSQASAYSETIIEDISYLSPMGDMDILPSLPQGRELVGGWFDPNDVPTAVRDHLLDLFFSKTNAGNLFHVVFHLPRLYTRLTMPPNKRPHPCLMYAMYSCAARLSSQPTIKQLEGQFYSIAEKQIRLAIKNHDRLLDVVRAMALLVSYLFAKEQYSLGYHMTGTAVRLAISCGLDRIPSSVWSPQPPFNAAIHCTLRMGGYSLPPPEDPIDLAERIYAFWAVYETDLCTSVAYLWHPGFPIDEIRTPLPRPMIEYELGIVSEKDDVPITSLFGATPPPYSSDTSFVVLRLKAVTFLARVLKLRQDKPEIELPMATLSTPEPHGCSYPGSPFPAHITHPQGFARLKSGLDRFVASLPENYQPPWQWDSEDDSDLGLPRISIGRHTSILHFLIGNAYMQLWNVRALDAENKIAILIARRLVNVMYLFQTEPLSTGYDIFMITIWNEVAMVLVREAKRLLYVGQREQAAVIDADLGVAITALKKWGDVDLANEHDGADIAAMNGKMLDQLRAMSEQDWAEAVAESQRRYGGGCATEHATHPSSGSTPSDAATEMANLMCPSKASSLGHANFI